MGRKVKDLREDAVKAVGQAAAEYKYLQEEKEDLLKLQTDLAKNPRQSKQDIRAAIRLFRSRIGRTERRINQIDLEKDIEELKAVLPANLKVPLEKLKQGMHIALSYFAKELSRTTGTMRDNLGKLETKLEVYERKPNQALFDQLRRDTAALVQEVDETIKWIQSFEVELQEYDKFLKYLEAL